MKTIELDLANEQKLESLSGFLKNKNIKLGEEEFQLKIYSYYDVYDQLYAAFLLLLVKYFFSEKVKNNKTSPADGLAYDKESNDYYEFYLKNYDVSKLENKIERDFKIDIELEKKNPLDDVFGIWKDEDITLDKIREKAWQRTK